MLSLRNVGLVRVHIRCASFQKIPTNAGKVPPTLEEFDPLNPGEWQLGAGGKILPRLPEGTKVGKLVMGKYGLYCPKLRKRVETYSRGLDEGRKSEDAGPFDRACTRIVKVLVLRIINPGFWSMRSGQRASIGNAVNECEFAVEAKAVEPLKLIPLYLTRHALSSEYARVCRQPIDVWFGLLFIRRGVYGGGIFRFNEVKFDLPIFHPDICPMSYVLDLRRYFPEGWKKDKHHIQNVLLVVQRLFFSSFEFDPNTCVNPTAVITWRNDRSKFKSTAKICVNQSRMEVYDEPQNSDDANVLRLTPWDPSLHEQIRFRMMLYGGGACDKFNWERIDKQTNNHAEGLSWVDTEAMTYMTVPVKELHFSEMGNIGTQSDASHKVHGIERLDLSGIQHEEILESDRSDSVSVYPISLPSTTLSSPEHRKSEAGSTRKLVLNNVCSTHKSSHAAYEEVTDV
ncbi:ubiquitin--protein ligase [Dictyocaulus viviparus]|uniref:Ubiquitin--protein ligase n=1 Tax=Dictyocaulus viviparus TaxID=29172 RepID=A0A0D8Y3N5_DICVI|nr:ubiquitin--protein ligase [Dictyocaulus viviparus]